MGCLACLTPSASAAVRFPAVTILLTVMHLAPPSWAAHDGPSDGGAPEFRNAVLMTSQAAGPPPVTDRQALPSDQDPQGSTKSAVPERRRAEVRRLLERLRPDLNPDVVEVWVEQFAELPDEDIRFLVSQSPLFSRSTDLPIIFSRPDRASAPGQADSRQLTDPFRELRVAVRRNLNNLMTPGYREEILLTASRPSASQQPAQTVRSFSTGDIIVTGIPFHLAIETPGRVFFVLNDGLLTRSGLFVRRPDGRLGWQNASSPFVLKDSPVLPDPPDCTIDSTGRVIGSAGQDLGRISVVRVTGSASLHSDDGVFFARDPATDIVPEEKAVIRSGCLELSNVNMERNSRLLQVAAPRIPSVPRNTPAAASFSEE